MSSDEIPADGDGARHTVVRKSLLKRLHMPLGTAVALAAMPSAALLGMGFTSPLAKADQQPDNPFRDGPCVEMPDTPLGEEDDAAASTEEGEAESDDATESSAPSTETSADQPPAEDDRTADDAEAESDGAGEVDEAEQDAEESADPERGAESEDEEQDEEQERENHPLDPLGLGGALDELGQDIRDFFTGGDEEAEAAEESDAPSEDERDEEEPDESETEREEPPAARETAPEEDSSEETASDEESPEPADESAESDVPPAREEGDPFAPDEDGKVPFPCPETAQVAGQDERTPQVLPNDPWFLEASYLTLRGLDYHGVVNITTADGSTKQALKFTADELDIGDLHQIVDSDYGVRYHVQAAEGSESTFRDGNVTMYTERLEGKLFGIIPIVFDPENEPPLDIPYAYFSDVLVTQAGQFGGTLTIPGMRNYIENS